MPQQNQMDFPIALSKAAKTLAGAATGLAVLLPSVSQAAVPEVVGTTITTLTTDATSIFTTVFPFVAAVLGMLVVVKLFKRFVNKA